MGELDKKAFADLIAEDRELLKYYVPRCLERQHIDTVLTDAVINFDKDKRITELKEAGRELLIEAMNLHDAANHNPIRLNARKLFEDEIKIFGLPEGGADELPQRS